jgi:hypothetical protein
MTTMMTEAHINEFPIHIHDNDGRNSYFGPRPEGATLSSEILYIAVARIAYYESMEVSLSGT